MKILRLWTLLLVPIFSAQAFAQIDTLTVENDSADTEYMQEEETDDNALRVQVKGFLDTYHAVRTGGRNEWMASRTRARGEVKLEKGAASLFVSMNATYNGVLKDRTGLELREAYLAYTKGNLDLRVGRQIVVWGVADALRVTDCVSPAPLPYTIDLESGKPEKRLRNMEYGGRITTNLSGIDFSLSALRTWNKTPALSLAVSDDGKSLLAKGEYRRMTMLGADCSLPVGQIVLRGEAACYFDEAQSRGVGKDVVCRNTYNILAGVDWYPGNDWNFSAQYCHKYTAGNLDGLSVYRNAGLATARISKELLRNMLKLSTFAYIDVANGGVFNRFSASYALNDQIELTAGYDFFHADKGKFQMYDRNSEIWAKMKYSF